MQDDAATPEYEDNDELLREAMAKGLHNDIHTAQPDGTTRVDPPRKSLSDCP